MKKPGWKFYSTTLIITALIAWGLHWLSGLPFFVAWGMTIAAMLITGWIATLEDEQPGGFNNPRPPEGDKTK